MQAQRLLARTGNPDWAYLLSTQLPQTRARHEALRAALKQGIAPEDCTDFAVLNHGAFAEEPRQIALQVGLKRGCPQLTASVTQKLAQVLPVVVFRTPRPARNDDLRPYKCIGLFEHSLSAQGIYFLAINEAEQMFQVRRDRHGFQHTLEKADSLAALLAIVEDKYFYTAVGAN